MASSTGTLHFKIQKQEEDEGVPEHFFFKSDLRLKAVKVGRLKMFGAADMATKGLYLFTYDDFCLVFYDFHFEVNSMHVGFKHKLQKRMRSLIKPPKPLKNPILARL